MEEISKEKIQLPKSYFITPKFSSIFILGGKRVVIDFENAVNSAIVIILSTPGCKIDATVKSSVFRQMFCCMPEQFS